MSIMLNRKTKERALAIGLQVLELPVVERVVHAAGGPTKLSIALEVSRQTIYSWIATGKIPSEHCLEIEDLLAGLVSRYEMRPDIYGEE